MMEQLPTNRADEAELQFEYRQSPTTGALPAPSPELVALVVQHAPGEISSLLQGPRLQRVRVEGGARSSRDRGAGGGGKAVRQLFSERLKEQDDEGDEEGDGDEDMQEQEHEDLPRLNLRGRQSGAAGDNSSGAMRASSKRPRASGDPTREAQRDPAAPSRPRPHDAVAREKREKEASEREKAARKAQQLALLAKVKKQQEQRARALKFSEKLKREEERDKAEREAAEAVAAAEAAKAATERWHQQKQEQRRTARKAAELKARDDAEAQGLSPVRNTPGSGDQAAGGEGGGGGGGPRDPHEYEKPWRRHMKRKAAEEPPVSASAAASPAQQPIVLGAAPPAEQQQEALASPSRRVGESALPPREDGSVREDTRTWMERKDKERKAAMRNERLREAKAALERKARVEKALKEAEESRKRSVRRSSKAGNPTPWDADFIEVSPRKSLFLATGGAGPVPPMEQQQQEQPKQKPEDVCFQLGGGSSRKLNTAEPGPKRGGILKGGHSLRSLVPESIVSKPPKDGAAFEVPNIDTTFGEWDEEVVPHLAGTPNAGRSNPMRAFLRSNSNTSEGSKRVKFGGGEEAVEDDSGAAAAAAAAAPDVAMSDAGSSVSAFSGSAGSAESDIEEVLPASDEFHEPEEPRRDNMPRREESFGSPASAEGGGMHRNDSIGSDAVHHGFVDTDSMAGGSSPLRKDRLRPDLDLRRSAMESAATGLLRRHSNASDCSDGSQPLPPRAAAASEQPRPVSSRGGSASKEGEREGQGAAATQGRQGQQPKPRARASSTRSPDWSVRSSGSSGSSIREGRRERRQRQGAEGSRRPPVRPSSLPPSGSRQSSARVPAHKSQSPTRARRGEGAEGGGPGSPSKFRELLEVTGLASAAPAASIGLKDPVGIGGGAPARGRDGEDEESEEKRKAVLVAVAQSIAQRISNLQSAPLTAPITAWGPAGGARPTGSRLPAPRHSPSEASPFHGSPHVDHGMDSDDNSFDDLATAHDRTPLLRRMGQGAPGAVAPREAPGPSIAELAFRHLSPSGSDSDSPGRDEATASRLPGTSAPITGLAAQLAPVAPPRPASSGRCADDEAPFSSTPPRGAGPAHPAPSPVVAEETAAATRELSIIDVFFRRFNAAKPETDSAASAADGKDRAAPERVQPWDDIAMTESSPDPDAAAGALRHQASQPQPPAAAESRGEAAEQAAGRSSASPEVSPVRPLAAESPSPTPSPESHQPAAVSHPGTGLPADGFAMMPTFPTLLGNEQQQQVAPDPHPSGHAEAAPGGLEGRHSAGGGAAPPPWAIEDPNQRPRKSPAELSSLLSSELARLTEVEETAQELSALEYARRLAQEQQRSERAVRELEATRAAAQQEAALKAVHNQQEDRMAQQVERVRQEIRSESLHQLQDVTQLFLQNLNYSKLQHADTQTKEVAEAEVQTVPEEPPQLPPAAEVPSGSSRQRGTPPRHPARPSTSESIVSEDLPSGALGDSSSAIDEVPTGSIADESIEDRTGGMGSRSPSEMQTESIDYTEDFTEDDATMDVDTGVTGLGYTASASQGRTTGSAVAVGNEVSSGSSGGISRELRDRFVVEAERRAEEQREAIRAQAKAAKERAAVKLRQLQAEKARLPEGNKARKAADQQMHLSQMQLQLEEADASQRLAAVDTDLQRQKLAWEQLTAAYLGGDLGPGGEDVLRLRLLERRTADLSVAEEDPSALNDSSMVSEDIASRSYQQDLEVSGSASAVPESVVSSRPASEVDDSGGYSDDAFDSIADEVSDGEGEGSSFASSPTRKPPLAPPPRAAAAAAAAPLSGMSSDEQTLAELTRRGEQLSRERRRLKIQAKQAEISRMETEIAELRGAASASAAAGGGGGSSPLRGRPTGTQQRVSLKPPRPLAPKSQASAASADDSIISEEGALTGELSPATDEEDIAVESPATSFRMRTPGAAHDASDSVLEESMMQSSVAESVGDYTQDFEEIHDSTGDDSEDHLGHLPEPHRTATHQPSNLGAASSVSDSVMSSVHPGASSIGASATPAVTEDLEEAPAAAASPRAGDMSMAYTEDFDEAPYSSVSDLRGSREKREAEGASAMSEVESEAAPGGPASAAAVSASMGYTEDFEEEAAVVGRSSIESFGGRSSAAAHGGGGGGGGALAEEDSIRSDIAAESRASRTGLSVAYTEDFEEDAAGGGRSSIESFGGRSSPAARGGGAPPPLAEEDSVRTDLAAESRASRTGLSMGYTEDFEEDDNDSDGGGGGGLGNIMDASDIEAMLIEEEPPMPEEEEINQGTGSGGTSFSMSEGELAEAELSIEFGEDEAAAEAPPVAKEDPTQSQSEQAYTMSFQSEPGVEVDEDDDELEGSVEFEEDEETEATGAAPAAAAAAASPAAASAAPDPLESGSTLEYTEDFEASKLSSSAAFPEVEAPPPHQPAETQEPKEPEPAQGPPSPTASTDVAEESILEDLGEDFELEAHHQMLEIMTKPQSRQDEAPAAAPPPLAVAAGPHQEAPEPEEATAAAAAVPPSPSEHYTTDYTTEFEQDVGAYTADFEDPEEPASPARAAAEDSATNPPSPLSRATTAYSEMFDDLEELRPEEEEEEEAMRDGAPVIQGHYRSDGEDDDLDGLEEEEEEEAGVLDCVSDLGSEPEELISESAGSMKSNLSGPIEAPDMDPADFLSEKVEEQPEEPKKSKAKEELDAEALANSLVSRLFADALDDMCEARLQLGPRHEALVQAELAVAANSPSSTSPSAEPPSPKSPPSSLRNLPTLVVNSAASPHAAKLIDEVSRSPQRSPTSPTQSSPLERTLSIRSAFSEYSEDSDSENTVRQDRKYIGRYVYDIMRRFLAQDQSLGDTSMDFEVGREVLGLNGFIQLEGARPDVNENQHVHNKLIYDVANEVLSATDHGVLAMAMADRRAGRALTKRIEKQVLAMALPEQAPDEGAPAATADAVLALEAQEQDRIRSNLEGQEQEVVAELADMVYDDLVAEVAAILADMG